MKVRKKPVVVEAYLYTGHNVNEILEIVNDGKDIAIAGYVDSVMIIDTLEGPMKADSGDFIIRGVKGEFYPCKPDIFEMTYDPVEE